jgi:hypothetical protein
LAAEVKRTPAAGPEEDWSVARLLPTTGIRGQEEQEKRATSCLLATMRAVPDFGRALVADLGGPRGRIKTFAEVQLKDSSGKTVIPDGAIVVEWGKSRWHALVEVKTGAAELGEEQVSRYLDVAKQMGLDAVITISNQITASPAESPLGIAGSKLKKVDLRHLSWYRVITEAVVQHRHRGISDPDQAFILEELIAYLEHERSGASGFQDMGQEWVKVRESVRDQTLRASDPEARAVVERWEQFVDYLCLGLSQELGREVSPVRSKKQAREDRLTEPLNELADAGILRASLRVPDAIASVEIEADLRSRRVTTSVQVAAPKDKKARGRVGWMLGQLKRAPPDLRIAARFARSSETTACLLEQVRADPSGLLSPNDPKREPRLFELALSRPMGKKRGRGGGSFAEDTRRQTLSFYREIVQDLKPWRAPAPKLPEEPSEEDEPEPSLEPAFRQEVPGSEPTPS